MSERKAFDRILALLHEAALDPEQWLRATALIDDALPAALDSILAQDYGGVFEAIVADGSDTTATRELLRARFANVRRVPNPEGIVACGLNRALAAARHDVIARCDAHSTLPPDYLAQAVRMQRRTGAANVGGRVNPVGTTRFGRAVALATCSPLGAGDARYRIGGAAGPVDTAFPGVFRRDALEAAALHGPGFEAGAVENALRGFAQPVKRLRLDGELTLGAVLAAAAAAADGPLLAKMDDDDVYGPEHLWDLVLAHEYSGAALVGKFAATVYLARCDRTVRRHVDRARRARGGAAVDRAGAGAVSAGKAGDAGRWTETSTRGARPQGSI